MRVSKHISLAEATRSQTATRLGISNTPDEETLKRMKLVAEKCFEPIRKWYGRPITVSSFYRSPELNKAIGGSKTSQHTKGEAIDIDTGDNAENKKILEWARANLEFDQLLWEYGNAEGPDWVHISFSESGNRNQFLYIK